MDRLGGVRLYEQDDPEAFLDRHGRDFSAIAGYDVPEELIRALPNLKLIANFGVGYDGVDVAAARARGISVTNTPDVLNDAMAELAIGLMISLCRKIIPADRFVRQGGWRNGFFPLQRELRGATVGIVGLGRIGREIALRCQAMKMRVIYHGRSRQENVPYPYYDNLVEMAQEADWLVCVAPGGAQTFHLIGREVLDALGPQGFLLSMGRGTTVDEKVLVEKLLAGELAGAALDVFENEPDVPKELFALDNVVLSPHQGSATRQTRRAMGALVVANLEAFFAGEPLLSRVV